MKYFKNNWIEFHPKFSHFMLKFSIGHYFDPRPQISVCLGWGELYLCLPIVTKYNECEVPTYGIYYFGKALWFCLGRKTKCIYMPWMWSWVRTSVLREDDLWETEIQGEQKNFYLNKWDDILWGDTLSYTYKLNNGDIQERIATIRVHEMEWRWYWFKWLKYPRMIIKSIEIKFNKEVGEQTGSWKGGVLGCSYEMRDNETPYECLRRMEKERKFN
jgi:hypothetical protein